jgi:Raf kinase inhibitor-like YbhB/YbcL family protein
MRKLIAFTLALLAITCRQGPVRPQGTVNPSPAAEPTTDFMLSSPAFANNEVIPDRYTGKDSNYSPALNWFDPPTRTKSFALVVEDPDAPMGTFTHWFAYNIPATANRLGENVPRDEALSDGTRQLMNDAGRFGYTGPMPPPGKAHHYIFTLYALDQELNPVSDKAFLIRTMEGHILAKARLVGTCQR